MAEVVKKKVKVGKVEFDLEEKDAALTYAITELTRQIIKLTNKIK